VREAAAVVDDDREKAIVAGVNPEDTDADAERRMEATARE